MPRHKSISCGAINVRVHPHGKPNIYQELFKKAHRLKKAVRILGDRHLMISHLKSTNDGIITGSLARFTDIDMDLPWYDISSLDTAKSRDIKSVNIPRSLKPNYKAFFFAFDVKKHIFAVETKASSDTLSVRLVRKFLIELLSDEKIVKKFGIPSIDVICDSQKLTKMLKVKTLRQLTISLQKPNPDLSDPDEADQFVENKLLKQNAQQYVTHLKAVPGKSLVPDQETKDLAKLAVKNGSVEADGKDADGLAVKYSSNDHPLIVSDSYDPNTKSDWEAFIHAATKLFL